MLRPDVTLLPLDDDVVAFSESGQCLLGLNPMAATVVREMQRTASARDLEKMLVSREEVPPADAGRWVSETIDALAAHGLMAGHETASAPEAPVRKPRWLAEMLPFTPIEQPAEERLYRLLETCVLVRFSHLAQIRVVDAVIGHLAVPDGQPVTVIDLPSRLMGDGHLVSSVYRDGDPVGHAWRLSHVGPLVKASVWQAAINGHDFLYYFHSGVVGNGTSCLLLPAAAGSGKSSLTTALALGAGYRFFSDEVALIRRSDFRVTPVPLAICCKSTGWDLMSRFYPAIDSLPVHWRADDKRVRYIPPPADALLNPPTPVSHVIFPRYRQGEPTLLRPIARAEALGRLMGECQALSQRLDRANVAQTIDWMSAVDCFELNFSSLDDAARLIGGVFPFKPS